MASLIPLGLGALSSVFNLFGNKSKNDAEQAQRNLENKFVTDTDAAKRDAIAKLAANGVNIFGPQTTTGTQFGNSTSSGTSRTVSDQSFRNNPFITAAYAPMEARLKELVNNRLNAPETVTEAEKAAQLRSINAASAGALQSIRNLAGRGISAQQLAAAGTPVQMARAGQIGNYFATLPDLERSRRNQDLAMSQGLISQFGLGQEGTSHGVSTTNSNQSTASTGGSSQTGGPNYSAIQAFALPTAPMQTMKTGLNPLATAGGDLSSALAQWFTQNPIGGGGHSNVDHGNG